MRYLLSTIIAISILVSCQPPTEKRYLVEGPEIDHAKKFMEVYLSGNLDAIPGMYYDTAKVFRNASWLTSEGFTPAQYAADLQRGLEGITSYTFESPIWECIINEEGDHWVHFWGIWKGIHEGTGKEYEIPVHASMLVEGGKIHAQADFFNNTQITMDIMAYQQQMAAESEETEESDTD